MTLFLLFRDSVFLSLKRGFGGMLFISGFFWLFEDVGLVCYTVFLVSELKNATDLH